MKTVEVGSDSLPKTSTLLNNSLMFGMSVRRNGIGVAVAAVAQHTQTHQTRQYSNCLM